MRLLRVPVAIAVTAFPIAALMINAASGCHLRTGPELDAQTRLRDGKGSGDAGADAGGGLLDGGLFDARELDAGTQDGRAADAMPNTPHM